MDFTKVMNTFLNIDGVVKVHNLRIWALSMDKTAISAHLAICKYVSLSFRETFNLFFILYCKICVYKGSHLLSVN
jgi:Co/Zn/Cd efflux system component